MMKMSFESGPLVGIEGVERIHARVPMDVGDVSSGGHTGASSVAFVLDWPPSVPG